MFKKLLLALSLLLLISPISYAYQQRFMNFGITSFMDGMPLPNGKGFYLYAHTNLYSSNNFKDGNGFDLPDTYIKNTAILAQLIYQSDLTLLSGKLGTDLLAIYVSNITLPTNPLGLTANSTGFDDIVWGVYLQWDPILIHGRPFMANRFEVSTYFPTGKFNKIYDINPGADHYSVEPYWASTIFILPRWTISWRLHYLFNRQNHESGIRPGDTFHMNFATSFAIIPRRLRLGIAGYYLQQVEDSRLHGVRISNSKERMFAIGPGMLVSFSKQMHFYCNAYIENYTKNRPQGTRIVLGLLASL